MVGLFYSMSNAIKIVSIKTGQKLRIRILKTGQNIFITIAKTGQMLYCVFGGESLCIEKTLLR